VVRSAVGSWRDVGRRTRSDLEARHKRFGSNHNGRLSEFVLLAGLAPRLVVSAVQETLRRLWLPTTTFAAQAPRAVPLAQLRGISPAVEERLNEEGIYDSFTMAMANPLRLLRNTPFDRRQIVAGSMKLS